MFKKLIGQKRENLRLTVVPGIAIDRAWSTLDLVGRELLMFAEVENGVTKSCPFFRWKNRNNAI